MKKSKKILSLLLLLGMLSSCGGNSSIAPETSEKASEATSEVVSASTEVEESSEEIIQAIIPTFTADEDITQTGLNLTDGYRIGETLSFEVSLPSMYKESTLEVTLNGAILAPADGIYSYTVEESDTALEITASADLIDITPTITKAEEVSLIGLDEVVHPNTEISFSVGHPERLTVTEVNVNGNLVRASRDGKYYYTLEKTDTECAIVVVTENTKVKATGLISYHNGLFTKNQSDFISVIFENSDGEEIDATTQTVGGRIRYNATLPEFGNYTIKLIYTDDDEVDNTVFLQESTYDSANASVDYDIGEDIEIAERTTWKQANIELSETQSKQDVSQNFAKGIIEEDDDYLVTFNWSYTGKIRGDDDEFINDPTFGNNSNKNASWSVDALDSDGKSLNRFEQIAWSGKWYFKIYNRGTSSDYQIQKNIGSMPYYKNLMKQWNSEDGQTFAIGRHTINGVIYQDIYVVEDGKYYLSTHAPLSEDYAKEVAGLKLAAYTNGGFEYTQGNEVLSNIVWQRNPFGESGNRFVHKPGYGERNSSTLFYLQNLTGFMDKVDTDLNREKNGTNFRLADQDFIIKWHAKNPYILNDDGTIRESGSEIGDWTGMAFTGRWYPYGSQTQFTVNFFHFCSNTGTSKKWAFRPTISGVTMADGDLTEDEIKAVGNSQLDIVVQKKGWHFEVYTVLNGVASYKTGGDMDADHQATWTMPYYLDASIAGATDTFKNNAKVEIDEIIFSPNENEFLTH